MCGIVGFTRPEPDARAVTRDMMAPIGHRGPDDAGVFVDLSVASNDDAVCLVQASQSGNFFAIFEDSSATGGTFYGASAAAITCPSSAGAPSSPATVAWSNTGFPAVP